MRETNFGKMNKRSKEKWSCIKCKTPMTTVSNTNSTQYYVSFVGSNETLSVKCMRNQFNVFGKQSNEISNSINELKEES